MTHRGTGRQAPDQRAHGQRWEGCIPHRTLPQPVLLPPDVSGALPEAQGSLSPGLRLLPLPQLERLPWGSWVSVPMILSFHPPSQCQQALGTEITPVVPSAPTHLWLLSPLGPSPGRGAAARSSVAGRGTELSLFWEEVWAGAALPVRQALQSWLDTLRMRLLLWAVEYPPLKAQTLSSDVSLFLL